MTRSPIELFWTAKNCWEAYADNVFCLSKRFSRGICFPRKMIRNNLQFWESVPRGRDPLTYCQLIPQLPILYSLEASSSVAGFARTNISTTHSPSRSISGTQVHCDSPPFFWRWYFLARQYCCCGGGCISISISNTIAAVAVVVLVGTSHQVAGEELPRKEEAICDILTLLRKFCN